LVFSLTFRGGGNARFAPSPADAHGGDLTGDLKTNRDESLTEHVGFVYPYANKAKTRKINDEKGCDKQKKQES